MPAYQVHTRCSQKRKVLRALNMKGGLQLRPSRSLLGLKQLQKEEANGPKHKAPHILLEGSLATHSKSFEQMGTPASKEATVLSCSPDPM